MRHDKDERSARTMATCSCCGRPTVTTVDGLCWDCAMPRSDEFYAWMAEAGRAHVETERMAA